MYATGKLAQTTAEMRRYKLHVLGISESRWTDSGRMRTKTRETLQYSSRETGQHLEGVAVILKKRFEKSLMEWNPIGNSSQYENMTLFQCYSSTNDTDEEVKNASDEQLQQELDNTYTRP